jgi:hypothetical protein
MTRNDAIIIYMISFIFGLFFSFLYELVFKLSYSSSAFLFYYIVSYPLLGVVPISILYSYIKKLGMKKSIIKTWKLSLFGAEVLYIIYVIAVILIESRLYEFHKAFVGCCYVAIWVSFFYFGFSLVPALYFYYRYFRNSR